MRFAHRRFVVAGCTGQLLKLHEATWRKSGIVIDATESEVKELLSRAEYKIEVAQENMSDEPAFWRGQLSAWRALIKQIKNGGMPAKQQRKTRD